MQDSLKPQNMIPASFPKSTKFVFVLKLSSGTDAEWNVDPVYSDPNTGQGNSIYG